MNSRLPATLALALALCLGLGSAALAQEAEEMDLSTMVQAPGQLMLGEGVKVGYSVTQSSGAGGAQLSWFIAVVGQTETTWEVESNQATMAYASLPGGEGLALSMEVDKKTLRVLSAKLGAPGEVLKPVSVGPFVSPPPAVKATPGRQEEVTLPSGRKVQADVFVTEAGTATYTSWTGLKDTPLEGVLIKLSGTGGGSKELASDPEAVEHELEELDDNEQVRRVPAIKVVYSDGSEMLLARDPVSKAMGLSVIAMKNKGMQFEVVDLRTDATRTLGPDKPDPWAEEASPQGSPAPVGQNAAAPPAAPASGCGSPGQSCSLGAWETGSDSWPLVLLVLGLLSLRTRRP